MGGILGKLKNIRVKNEPLALYASLNLQYHREKQTHTDFEFKKPVSINGLLPVGKPKVSAGWLRQARFYQWQRI